MPNQNPSHDGALKPQNLTREERIQRMGKMKEQHNGLKKLVKENDTSILDNLEIFNHGLTIPKTYGRVLSYDSSDIISQEIGEFMKFVDSKRMSPTWVGLALWLGVDTSTLSKWKEDPSCPFNILLKKTSEIFHNFAQQKAMDGELNPLMYFFLAKNYWGLHDKTEIVHKSQSTQIIDISDQQRIINATPGIIIDGEYTEKAHISNLSNETQKEDIDYQSIQNVLRGANTEELEPTEKFKKSSRGALKSSRKVQEKFEKSSKNDFEVYENDTKMTLDEDHTSAVASDNSTNDKSWEDEEL